MYGQNFVFMYDYTFLTKWLTALQKREFNSIKMETGESKAFIQQINKIKEEGNLKHNK